MFLCLTSSLGFQLLGVKLHGLVRASETPSAWLCRCPKAKHPWKVNASASSHSAHYNSLSTASWAIVGNSATEPDSQTSVFPSGNHTGYKRINEDELELSELGEVKLFSTLEQSVKTIEMWTSNWKALLREQFWTSEQYRMIVWLSLVQPYYLQSYFWQVSVEPSSEYQLSTGPYVGSAWGVNTIFFLWFPAPPTLPRKTPRRSGPSARYCNSDWLWITTNQDMYVSAQADGNM